MLQKNIHRISMTNSSGKRSPGRPWWRREHKINMSFRKVCEDWRWIELPRDRVRWCFLYYRNWTSVFPHRWHSNRWNFNENRVTVVPSLSWFYERLEDGTSSLNPSMDSARDRIWSGRMERLRSCFTRMCDTEIEFPRAFICVHIHRQTVLRMAWERERVTKKGDVQ